MNKRVAAIIVLIVITSILFCNISYATDQNMSFRNGDITLTAPDYYQLTERDWGIEYWDYEKEYRYCNNTIFDSDNEHIRFYCDYVYFDKDSMPGSTADKAAAAKWYQDNKDYIEEYLKDTLPFSITVKIPKTITNKNSNYIRSKTLGEGWVRVKCGSSKNKGDAYVYMNCSKGNNVFKLIQYAEWDSSNKVKLLSEEEIAEADSIIQSFEDSGDYSSAMLSGFNEITYNAANDSEDDSNFGIELFLALGSIIGGLIITFVKDDIWQKGEKCLKDKMAERKYYGKDQFSMHESSHEENLKVMKMSGLMTETEMNEMLQKHRETKESRKERGEKNIWL